MNLMYGVFPSPLGNILIARSGEGVAGVEFLGSRGILLLPPASTATAS